MDLLSVIRRWHGRDKLPIREITRRTGLSRNTIRKYLANGTVEPKYPARKSISKLDPYAETLASWLKREAGRSRKRRRNLKQLHRDLMALGFDGSYDRVAAYARDWRQRERERSNRAVSLRVYAARLVIVAEARVIAEHVRIFIRGHDRDGQTVYDWRHYLAVVQRKPGALRNGAPFAELPKSFRQLRTALMKRDGGDREMADILALVLHHDEKLVEQAVREAIASGILSKTHILNRLSRLLDMPPPAALEPPPALSLLDEPVANTERYDNLRENDYVG